MLSFAEPKPLYISDYVSWTSVLQWTVIFSIVKEV